MSKSFSQSVASISEIWSLTSFKQSELSEYAGRMLFLDTRKGIMTLCMVLFLLLSSSAGLYAYLGYETSYVYSSSVLAVLSLHMSLSMRAVKETRVLYLLATTLIVIIGVAMVLLAHKSGGFNSALFASVVLLFLVMPLVPWGFREALTIVFLVYGVFTASTLSVGGRFDAETLWVLQFFMLGASLTTLLVIARNTRMRKNDIKMRFELEQAHDHMERLSLKDHLTDAWNRRFLEMNFQHIVDGYRERNQNVHFVTIDINNFKPLNDTYGHVFGDKVLINLVEHFEKALQPDEYLVRMGGDEFAVLMGSENPQQRLAAAAEALLMDPDITLANGGRGVHVSMGVIEIELDEQVTLNDIYRKADMILYRAKERKTDMPEQTIIEMKAIR